ncbi:hypothetical protein [Lysinibacillus agricola]
MDNLLKIGTSFIFKRIKVNEQGLLNQKGQDYIEKKQSFIGYFGSSD